MCIDSTQRIKYTISDKSSNEINSRQTSATLCTLVDSARLGTHATLHVCCVAMMLCVCVCSRATTCIECMFASHPHRIHWLDSDFCSFFWRLIGPCKLRFSILVVRFDCQWISFLFFFDFSMCIASVQVLLHDTRDAIWYSKRISNIGIICSHEISAVVERGKWSGKANDVNLRTEEDWINWRANTFSLCN